MSGDAEAAADEIQVAKQAYRAKFEGPRPRAILAEIPNRTKARAKKRAQRLARRRNRR